MVIRAITFDLWDTIVSDDTDEPKRKEKGLRPKKEERPFLIWKTLTKNVDIDFKLVNEAYNKIDNIFIKDWKQNSTTWPIEERIDRVLSELKHDLEAPEYKELVRRISCMEVDIEPDIIEGAADVLFKLSKEYKLAVISDTIVTPGKNLRDLLEKHGVKKYFNAFAFSDEVGRSKPHPSMFKKISDEFALEFNEMVHVGDRDHNDVKGSQAMGMKAVLFTASRSQDKDSTTANAICEKYIDLPGIIADMSVD